MLLNSLQCPGRPLPTEKYPPQNVKMSASRLGNLVRETGAPGKQVTQRSGPLPLGRTGSLGEKVAFALMGH